MIEILFLAQHFQCHAQAPMATFEVIINEEHVLGVGDTLRLPEVSSIKAVPVDNADCATERHVIEATAETLPQWDGLYDQPAVRTYAADLKDSESIFLYEFGSYNGDYQDVVLRIDWEADKRNVLYAD